MTSRPLTRVSMRSFHFEIEAISRKDRDVLDGDLTVNDPSPFMDLPR
jgi:hypothetical protein